MGRAAERVDQYVQQGYLTTDEGETVRQLSDIDKREKSGEIDAEEASHLRNSLLSDDLCTKLERKVKGAVDHAVRFLQAFESLQRVSTSVDEGLRFLIHHKNILDSELGPRERGLAAQELLEDREILRLVIDIMDRKDREIRMISVCLPPYSYIVKRGNERIGNLTIEEDFVDDLRELKADDMSEKLHSDDPMVRVRPAADIRCLVAILNHLIKATPWRKEVRMLRVRATLNQLSVTICVAMATCWSDKQLRIHLVGAPSETLYCRNGSLVEIAANKRATRCVGKRICPRVGTAGRAMRGSGTVRGLPPRSCCARWALTILSMPARLRGRSVFSLSSSPHARLSWR